MTDAFGGCFGELQILKPTVTKSNPAFGLNGILGMPITIKPHGNNFIQMSILFKSAFAQMEPCGSRGELPWTNNLPQAHGRPVQIGKETDWKAVEGRRSALLAVKTNGSLWKWNSESQPNKLSWKRLGNHS